MCYKNHHSNKECCDKNVIWTRDAVKDIKWEIVSDAVHSDVKKFLKTGQNVPNKQLKADIINDLYIEGKIFKTYMKQVLKTTVGRRRVSEKLIGKKKYLTSYTRSQKNDIKDILDNDEDGKYDDENQQVLNALNGNDLDNSF